MPSSEASTQVSSPQTPVLPESTPSKIGGYRYWVGWIVTPLYIALFYGILVGFHLPLMIAYRISYEAHKRVLEWMNFCILFNLKITAQSSIRFVCDSPIPNDRPIIFVSNHQSMYDIPLLIWNLQKYHPKFIAKRELAKGIPSISYALRTMGSAIIDRGDRAGSLRVIEDFAESAERKNYSACIFPEGTRARDGEVKPFKTAGFTTLLKSIPSARVFPVSINNSWQWLYFNLLPIPFHVPVTLHVMRELPVEGRDSKELLAECEQLIQADLAK